MHHSPVIMTGSPIRLVDCGRYERAKGNDFPEHTHPVWELIFYEVGQIRCVIEDVPHHCEPGLVLLIPPDTVHYDIADSTYRQLCVWIDAPPQMKWPRTVPKEEVEEWSRLFGAIERELHSAATHRTEMLRALAWQLDVQLRRHVETEPLSLHERTVLAAEKILERRFSTRITIEDVAREVGLSPSRLRALFAEVRGYSPQSMLQEIRVRHAARLLETSDLKLDAIAYLCGYDSPSHLSRRFRSVYGHPPGQHRHLPSGPPDLTLL